MTCIQCGGEVLRVNEEGLCPNCVLVNQGQDEWYEAYTLRGAADDDKGEVLL